jgi:hypothetical protein
VRSFTTLNYSSHIIWANESSRMRLVGYVADMGKVRNEYKILVGNLKATLEKEA